MYHSLYHTAATTIYWLFHCDISTFVNPLLCIFPGSMTSLNQMQRSQPWPQQGPLACPPPPTRTMPSYNAFNAYWSGQYHSVSCPNTPLQHPTAPGQQAFQFNTSITTGRICSKCTFFLSKLRHHNAICKNTQIHAEESFDWKLFLVQCTIYIFEPLYGTPKNIAYQEKIGLFCFQGFFII